jgi:hypothetical protein
VVSVSHFLAIGAFRAIGEGTTIYFWHDTWHDNYPLSLYFLLVYAKVKNDKVTLAQVWNLGNIKLHLTRGVSSAMQVENNKLLLLLRSVQFQLQPNSAIWHLEKSSLYTVHSLYKFLNSGGIHSPLTRSVWALKVPLKIKLFL